MSKKWILVVLLVFPFAALADNITWVNDSGDGWDSGESVAAADMNEIKTQVDDNNTEITALQAGTGQTLGGDLSGNLNAAVVADDSHAHVIGNVDASNEAGLETLGGGVDIVTVTTDDISTANLMTALSDEGAAGTYLEGDGTWSTPTISSATSVRASVTSTGGTGIATNATTYVLLDLATITKEAGSADWTEADNDEFCYGGTATLQDVHITFAFSANRTTGSGSDDVGFKLGIDTTGAIGNGDEVGPLYVRTFSTNGVDGLGVLDYVTDIAQNQCIGVLAIGTAGTPTIGITAASLTIDGGTASGNLDLGTGTIRGAVSIETTDGTSPDTVAAAEGQWLFTDDSLAYELDLPALTSGASLCIYSPTAHAITIDPNGTEVIVLDGVAESAGEAVVQTTPTAGDFVCLLSNGTNWYTLGKSGDWDGAVD